MLAERASLALESEGGAFAVFSIKMAAPAGLYGWIAHCSLLHIVKVEK
jgi:hypothetical protein